MFEKQTDAKTGMNPNKLLQYLNLFSSNSIWTNIKLREKEGPAPAKFSQNQVSPYYVSLLQSTGGLLSLH